MSNFKSDKPRKQTSLDGLLSSGPRKPRQPKSDDIFSNDGLRRRKTVYLDDFDKADGFKRNTRNIEDGAVDLTDAFNATETNFGDIEGEQTKKQRRSFNPFRRKSFKERKKRSKSAILFRRAAIFSVVLVLLVGGGLLGKLWWNANKALQGGGGALALNNEIDPNSLTGEGDGRVNILLMGKGGPEHTAGDLTDTIMIASVDPINNGVVLLSIPRDLWVKPSGLWPMKINAVYSSAKGQALYTNPNDAGAAETAGVDAIEKTVEEYMGVKINYYAMVDFRAFEKAVNIVGGITVNLDEPYSDPTMLVNGRYFSLKAGDNKLNGTDALAYARSRYGTLRGDLDRGQHQQEVILAIKDKALSVGTFANPLKISQLLDTFGNRVQTNFSVDDMRKLYELSKQINESNTKNVDLGQEGESVVTTGTIGDQSVVYPKAGVDDYSEVKKFVRKQLKDGFIIKENPSIIVLNGTSVAGLANKRANELKSYGYNVIQVADSSKKDYYANQFIDLTKGQKPYTKRYLELRFGTQATEKLDGFDSSVYVADYIIIVGEQ